MNKFFPKLFFITILSALFPIVSFAQVSKISFTTDIQIVKPGTLSGPITIQAQDSGGSPYQTPETIDLEFTSTSGTGQFLGSTGNPATTYMSKNTANRTFYYEDSNEGSFLITVNAKGRDSGGEWNASQQITVSSDASQDTSSDSSGEVLGSSTDSTSSSVQSSGGGGSTTNVSSPSAQLEVLTGGDRTTSPGSPIWFQATVKKNTTSIKPELSWSFGDGNVGEGFLVSHTYKYSGNFVVVLTAKAGDIFSVSRIKVKVADSDITVSDGGEYLEISNTGDTEINLFNWKLENNGKGFIFQPNTIILPHSSVKFDKSLLNMKGLDNSMGISLKNCMGREVFSAPPVKEVDISEASKNLEAAKQEFSSIQEKAESLGLIPQKNDFGAQSASVLSATQTKDDSAGLAEATDTGNIIYEAPKQSGFLRRTWNFITNIFN